MKKRISDRSYFHSKPGISATGLADFLIRLADLNSSEEYGNRDLSIALFQLANAVGRGEIDLPVLSRNQTRKRSELSEEKINDLKKLNQEAVELFLSDKSKTKSDLLELASARFSMPTSQLQRRKVDEVRAAITSAMLHESSIEILSSEADRDGAARTT